MAWRKVRRKGTLAFFKTEWAPLGSAALLYVFRGYFMQIIRKST
ncbi:hypothetical protein KEM60_01415 [Austwickia sp. TVS 96-490-7B]|nr:hypothetical protein [Austwickia sp. TVS 96-490-7B]